MHAGFQELLAVRDGLPVDPGIEEHVATCTHCSFELTRLARVKHDLRQLPAFEPPASSWAAMRGRRAERPARHRTRLALAAATGAAAIVAGVWLMRWEGSNAGAGTSAALGTLITRSQRLEAVLESLPRRPDVERASTSATIDDLQTRIQLVDLQLSDASKNDAGQALRLWNTRVQLLDSLVHVRYAEAARTGYNPSQYGVI
jgi:hypothetical protein